MKNKYSKLLFFCFLTIILIGCKRSKTLDVSPSGNAKPSNLETLPQVSTSQDASVAAPSLNANDKPLSPHGPKQRYSELVKLPKQPNPTTERLNREIKGINVNDPEFGRKMTQLWDESIAQISKGPLLSSENTEVAKGFLLPKEIELDLKEKDVGNDEESAKSMLSAVAVWSAMTRSDLLTKFANSRSNNLPPLSSDLAIFYAIDRSLEELGPIRKKSPFEPWARFSGATNPVYRLLALRAATYTTTQAAWHLSPESEDFSRVDASAKLGFYLSYLNEKDPVILIEAIRCLATVPLQEARQAIEEFHAQQLHKGDPVLIQASEEALKTQENTSR